MKKCHYINIYHNLFKKGLKFDMNIQKKVTSYDSEEWTTLENSNNDKITYR